MTQPVRSLEIELPAELLRIFHPLFQQGVEIEIEVGCTIKQLLTEQFGISAEYLAARISTLFLNSKAIDDAAKAVILDGAVLALSGAMPGLVGATMRSGGHLSAMRGAMTYTNEGQPVEQRQGRIRIKLFNLLLNEIGPRLLQWGILVSLNEFKEFIAAQADEFRLRNCRLDGRIVSADELQPGQGGLAGDTLLKLTVELGDR